MAMAITKSSQLLQHAPMQLPTCSYQVMSHPYIYEGGLARYHWGIPNTNLQNSHTSNKAIGLLTHPKFFSHKMRDVGSNCIVHPAVVMVEHREPFTAVDMVVPKSFPALCTPYVQVVHQPWKCTVHKSWKCLHRGSVQEVSKSCKKCFVSKSVSKSVLHNS